MIASPRNICAGAWLFGGLLGATLLVLLFAGVDLAPVRLSARQVPAWAWLVVALAWLGSFMIRAWRLQTEWSAVKRVEFGQCLRLVIMHGAALMIMPVRLGEVGYVYLVRREWRVDVGQAVRSLIWMRWQDATILVTLAIGLLAPFQTNVRIALAFFALGLGAVIIPRLSTRGLSKAAWFRRWRGAVSEHDHDVDGWVASLGNWLMRLGAVALLMLQMTPFDDTRLLGVAVGIESSGMLPVQGLGGLGTYEGGAWLAARAEGLDPPSVLGAVVVAHVFSLVLTLGAVAVARWTRPATPAMVERTS